MAASVLFACGLNESKLPQYIHISEESDIDGSFLISCIISQRLRISNAGVLLVCLQNNFKHYFNAGMRLGYNANIFVGKTLQVIDPLTEITEMGLDSKWLKETSDDKGSNETQTCELLLSTIKNQLETNFINRVSTTILIDNLSILINLGASQEAVARLCLELSNLKENHPNLSVITKLSNCDIYASADNNISKLGKVKLRIVKLKSGMFREVDGKLLIERENIGTAEDVYDDEKLPKEVLYKVNDRNVKIFNPGEI